MSPSYAQIWQKLEAHWMLHRHTGLGGFWPGGNFCHQPFHTLHLFGPAVPSFTLTAARSCRGRALPDQGCWGRCSGCEHPAMKGAGHLGGCCRCRGQASWRLPGSEQVGEHPSARSGCSTNTAMAAVQRKAGWDPLQARLHWPGLPSPQLLHAPAGLQAHWSCTQVQDRAKVHGGAFPDLAGSRDQLSGVGKCLTGTGVLQACTDRAISTQPATATQAQARWLWK